MAMPRRAAEPKKPARPFYAAVLDEAELLAALELDGVDEELAILRMRLKQQIKERPEDYELMLKGAQMIVRAAATRYRIGAKSRDELGSAVAAVIDGVGVQLFPEEAFDV
jgi:hypothetical protein